VNDPKTINNYPADAADFDEMTQQPADELMEVEAGKLKEVAGGSDGTAVGHN
jgi:hypothetical protein